MTRKRRRSLKCGIEIECVVNRDKLSRVNSRRFIPKGWKWTSDGSLRSMGEFNDYELVEFISDVSIGRGRFIKRLEDFKRFIISRSGTTDLSKVLVFNRSCGNHFHIGLTDNKKIGTFISFPLITKFRKDFFNKLKKLNIKEETKQSIINQYFRSYAQKSTKTNFLKYRRTRYYEFNRLSEDVGKGLEWRSFNLCGVDNWGDFMEVMLLGYDCFQKLVKKRMNGYKTPKQTRKIPQEHDKKDMEFKIKIEGDKELKIEEKENNPYNYYRGRYN